MRTTLTADQKKKLKNKMIVAHYKNGAVISGIVKDVRDDHVILAPKGGKAEIKAFFFDGFFPGFDGFFPGFFPFFFI
ncbi:hypothetical protein [Cohnella nanjingensis]|uniref:Uncharacterized protein n=1 Tax=Cohnella nanjingensis TaxID=1387779 RepID=A0A7X0RU49_9BACL|nr:hypothetical protein [Cohnella nanjingensis]MBB6673773.1 hypothetical protein [Cohnella nanjingensis]